MHRLMLVVVGFFSNVSSYGRPAVLAFRVPRNSVPGSCFAFQLAYAE